MQVLKAGNERRTQVVTARSPASGCYPVFFFVLRLLQMLFQEIDSQRPCLCCCFLHYRFHEMD